MANEVWIVVEVSDPRGYVAPEYYRLPEHLHLASDSRMNEWVADTMGDRDWYGWDIFQGEIVVGPDGNLQITQPPPTTDYSPAARLARAHAPGTDPRLAAIRTDPEFGIGSLSPIDESWSDGEILETLDERGVTTPAGALAWAAKRHALWIDTSTNEDYRSSAARARHLEALAREENPSPASDHMAALAARLARGEA